MSRYLFNSPGRVLGLTLSALLVMPASPSWAREAPAPVIEAAGESSASAKALEARVKRIERLLENQALVDLMTRMDSLQNEVQQMLGQMEEQAHEMENLKKRQRDLYLDIDQRLRKQEQARAAAPAMAPAPAAAFAPMPVPGASETPSTTTAPMSGTDTQADLQQERVAYERAFNLLKEGRYDLAVAAFKTFVQSYPNGHFTDNAQYWLGEANYVQRRFKEALSEFDKVVKNHPNSPKRADAMLKMGYTYQELGKYDEARLSLNNVVMNYPNSTAASLAQKRLQDLKRQQ